MAKSIRPSQSYTVSLGDVTGSAVTVGDNNTQTVTTVSSSRERADVDTSLLAIRRALDSLSGPHADRARGGVDDVIEAAKKPEPNKSTLGNLLDSALTAAKRTSEFSTVAAGLAPHVERIAHWLGGEWSQWITLT